MFQIIPPKQLILMQGVPGSGKSFWAKKALDSLCTDKWIGIIHSTDDYRKQPCGHYVHDVSQNAAHHAATQRDCVESMRGEVNYIIIDNTNIEKWQVAPYLALASMYGYEVIVQTIQVPLKTALARNAQRDANRRVPDGVIESMYEKMEILL